MSTEPSTQERAALGRALARRVAERAPVPLTEARRIIPSVLGALGAMLTQDERRPLANALPVTWGRALSAPAHHESMDLEGLYRAHARDRAPGEAREEVQVVLQAIGELAPVSACARVRRALPPNVAALFDAREVPDEPPSTARRSPRTLAAQRNSVAEPNPHGDTKLSSARELNAQRTIANATDQKRGF